MFLWPVYVVARLIDEAWKHDTWPVALYTALLAMAGMVSWSYLSTRLIVAPDGITFAFPGGTMYTAWDDMERIDEERRWYGRSARILLRREQSQVAPWARWLPGWKNPRIPLVMGGTMYWQPGVLEDLYDHAPWLFDDGPHARM